MIVRQRIPNMIAGVSQQAPELRLPEHCEAQDNGYSSVIDGLQKRAPTEHVATLDNANGVVDQVRAHWVNRDSGERYVMLFDDAYTNGVKIFDLADGSEVTLTGPSNGAIPAASVTYIKNSDARSNLRVLTVADTTIVANRTITCAMDTSQLYDSVDVTVGSGTSLKSKSARRIFWWVRSAG